MKPTRFGIFVLASVALTALLLWTCLQNCALPLKKSIAAENAARSGE